MFRCISLLLLLILVTSCRKEVLFQETEKKDPYYADLQPAELDRWELTSPGPGNYIDQVYHVDDAIIVLSDRKVYSLSAATMAQNWVLEDVSGYEVNEAFRVGNYLFIVSNREIVKIDFQSGALIEKILIHSLFQLGIHMDVKSMVRDGSDLYILASDWWSTPIRQFLVLHYDLNTEVHSVLYARQHTEENPFRPIIYRPMVWHKAAKQLIISMHFDDDIGMASGIYSFHPESRELRFRHGEWDRNHDLETIAVIFDDKYLVYQSPSRRLASALIDESTFTELFNDSMPFKNIHAGYTGAFSDGGSYYAYDHSSAVVQSFDILSGAVNWETKFSAISKSSSLIPNKKLMLSGSRRPERPGNIFGVQLIDLNSGQCLIEWFPEGSDTSLAYSFDKFFYLEEEHACIVASRYAVFKYALPELFK